MRPRGIAVPAAARRDPETPALCCSVREEAESPGLGRQIEGGFAAGQSLALEALVTRADLRL